MQHLWVRHLLIPHFTETRVLMVQGEEKLFLPRWLVDSGGEFWQCAITSAVEDSIGIQLDILRFFYYGTPDQQQRDSRMVLVAANRSPEWYPSTEDDSDYVWMDAEELEAREDRHFLIPEQKSVLTGWFKEQRSATVPRNRVPWISPSWFFSAQEWIHEELTRLGITITGSVRQLKSSERACLLRVETDQGAVFFKALPPVFAHEPTVTQALYHRFPENCPHVLVIDNSRGWMLTKDFGGVPIFQIPSVERWEGMLGAYAHLQIKMIDSSEELLQFGCPDRSLSHPSRHISQVLDGLLSDSDLAVDKEGRGDWLTQEELKRFASSMPLIEELCEKLLSCRIPQTIEHGDFSVPNIHDTGKRFVFFDWSDASLSHPFFSLLPFLRSLHWSRIQKEIVLAVPENYERLRNAYLQPWELYEPMPVLIEAFETAQTLAYLHTVVTIHRILLPTVEVPANWDWMIPWNIRRFLEIGATPKVRVVPPS